MGLYPNDLEGLTLAGMANNVLQALEKHGTAGVGGGNRVAQLCRIVQRSAGRVVQQGESDYEEIVQAFKDLQEWRFIFEVLKEAILKPLFIERYRRSLADTVLPGATNTQSRGRDAQLELFVAAFGIRAGFTVSDLGPDNPDWLFELPTGRWTVETKRLKNWNNLKDRVREAAAQIEKSEIGGVIVMDVGLAKSPKGLRLDQAIPDEVLLKMEEDWDLEFRKEYLSVDGNGAPSKIEHWIDGRRVGVLVVHHYRIRPAAKAAQAFIPWGLHGFWAGHILVRKDSSQHERYKQFWDHFGLGLPNY